VADNPLKVLLAQVQQPPEPPSELNPHVPADLEEVVLRCLAKEPRDRYPDVVELAAALDNCSDAHRWTPEDAARWWQEQALVGVPAAPSSMLDAREQVPA
jgi:serine/threonine-protein kinase